MRRTLALLALLGLLVPSLHAAASPFWMYHADPVEHDAQGAVAEPDGLRTSVLGPALTNCVLELPPFDGLCSPDPVPKPAGARGALLAPGCTGGDHERRLDGLCGLWTVGAAGLAAGTVPPPLSEPGMRGDAAPGAYTPTKASTVVFLDGRMPWSLQPAGGPTLSLDVHRRLAEAGRLTGLTQPLAGNALPPQRAAWAWFGAWTDRNGNGVVDHAGGHGDGRGAANEFTWFGNCASSDGDRHAEAIEHGLCREHGNPHLDPPGAPCEDPEAPYACAGTTLHAWLFPGHHHAEPAADLPGRQVLQLGLRLGDCGAPPSCDDADRDEAGDPLLGPQDGLAPDLAYRDATGDDLDARRGWAAGGGPLASWGDDGLLVTLVAVHGANCAPVEGSPRRFEPQTCTFLDVDREQALSPDIEALLVGSHDQPTGGLKATARSAWVLARDDLGVPALARFAQAAAFGRDLHVASQGELRGAADDALLAPGWSREPNAPGDRYVGVAWGACAALPVGDARNPTPDPDPEEREAQHRGFCNADAAGDPGDPYAAYREGRGWLDAKLVRSALFPVPVTPLALAPCLLCLAGPVLDVPWSPEPAGLPPDAAAHARTLGPGQYYLAGRAGVWRDAPSTHDESVFPQGPGSRPETYPADGWVGWAQRVGGQWRYRGFEPLACTTERDVPHGASLHEAAECNPYLDGLVEDPQDYSVHTASEWRGACDPAGVSRAWLAPADGDLATQLLVWRHHEEGLGPVPGHLPEIEVYGPGPAAPLELVLHCVPGAGGAWRGADLLTWALGNLGDDIVTWVEAAVPLGRDRDQDGRPDADHLLDEDRYAAWRAG